MTKKFDSPPLASDHSGGGVTNPIASVLRAFAVLERLSQAGSASIGEISAGLGLPKPTVVRILQTLAHAGYVQQISARGEYWITSRLRDFGCAFSGLPAILGAARSGADELTGELLWPVSIAERSHDFMVVRYSTLPASPYAHARSTVGKRLPLWTSAHGKAWLAYMAPEDRPPPPPSEAETNGSSAMLLSNLDHVLNRGYAVRTFGRDPSTNSIAVPIFCSGRIVATLGMTFFCRAIDPVAIPAMADKLRQRVLRIEEAAGSRSGEPFL